MKRIYKTNANVAKIRCYPIVVTNEHLNYPKGEIRFMIYKPNFNWQSGWWIGDFANLPTDIKKDVIRDFNLVGGAK